MFSWSHRTDMIYCVQKMEPVPFVRTFREPQGTASCFIVNSYYSKWAFVIQNNLTCYSFALDREIPDNTVKWWNLTATSGPVLEMVPCTGAVLGGGCTGKQYLAIPFVGYNFEHFVLKDKSTLFFCCIIVKTHKHLSWEFKMVSPVNWRCKVYKQKSFTHVTGWMIVNKVLWGSDWAW